MKKNLNKKGFTLVELLAVIVILAVIMVIATQQVNKAIKKSKGDTFYETVIGIRTAAQTVCAMENTISEKDLMDNVDKVDFTNDVVLKKSAGTDDGRYGSIVVEVKEGGKYYNNTAPKKYNGDFKITMETDNIGVKSFKFESECPMGTWD